MSRNASCSIAWHLKMIFRFSALRWFMDRLNSWTGLWTIWQINMPGLGLLQQRNLLSWTALHYRSTTSALLLFLFLVLWQYINLIYSSKTLCSFVNLVCMCEQWNQPSCRRSNQNWHRSSLTSTRCWDVLTRSQRTNTMPQV